MFPRSQGRSGVLWPGLVQPDCPLRSAAIAHAAQCPCHNSPDETDLLGCWRKLCKSMLAVWPVSHRRSLPHTYWTASETPRSLRPLQGSARTGLGLRGSSVRRPTRNSIRAGSFRSYRFRAGDRPCGCDCAREFARRVGCVGEYV